MPLLNLDTHVLLFALIGDLTPRERKLLAASPWSISAIVLWEIAKLVQLRRVVVDLDAPEVTRALHAVHVWPLDLEVAKMSARLDFAGDPADEIIAASGGGPAGDERAWPSLLRMLDREDPSYRD